MFFFFNLGPSNRVSISEDYTPKDIINTSSDADT